MYYAIMDDKGIIETFGSEDEAIRSIERVRKENEDITGDLKVIKVLYVDN